MSDQCVYCTLRGKSIEECRNIECHKFDDWITQTLSTNLDAAKARLREAIDVAMKRKEQGE